MRLPIVWTDNPLRPNRTLVVKLVASCSLAAIACIAPKVSQYNALYMCGVVVALGLTLASLKNMAVGLTALVLSAGTVSFTIGTGTQSAINLAMLLVSLLAGIWVLRMAATRRLRLMPSWLNGPLLAFLGSALLSWIAANVAAGSSVRLPGNILTVQGGQFAVYALSAAAFFLGANHALGERTLKAWTWFLVLLGTGIMVWDLAAGSRHSVGGWTGSLYMWPVVLLVGQVLFNPMLSRPWKVLAWTVVLVWVLWVTRAAIVWKGAWVPALLGLCLLFALKSWRLLLAAVLIVGIIVLAVGPGIVKDALLEDEAASANPVRPALWLDVFRMGLRSPVFGLGLATYSYHWQDPTFESISYRYVSTSAFQRDAYNPPAHNMYADVFAQMGALGMVFLLWTLLAGIRLGFLASRQAPAGFSQAYACSVLCGFVSMVISSFFFADWLLPYVYNIGLRGFPQAAYTWLLLGTLVPLATMGRSVGAEARPMACGSSSGVTSRSGGSAGRGGCA